LEISSEFRKIRIFQDLEEIFTEKMVANWSHFDVDFRKIRIQKKLTSSPFPKGNTDVHIYIYIYIYIFLSMTKHDSTNEYSVLLYMHD
jgi:hypothetical protein